MMHAARSMIDQNKESTVNNVVLKLFLWIQHETIYYTYLKKSVLQYNLPSLEKHRSAKILRQSAQRTHSACHVRSNTVSKNLSKMARSQPAHVMIILEVTCASLNLVQQTILKHWQNADNGLCIETKWIAQCFGKL